MGRKLKWDEKNCLEEAKKYKTVADFYKYSTAAYQSATRNGWKSGYTWLKVTGERKPKGTWDEESCLEEAKKYKTFGEFRRNAIGAYRSSERNGWIDSYSWLTNRYNSWDHDSCEEESRKYNNRNDFGKGCPSAYQASIRNGWIDEWFEPGKTTRKWTKDSCEEEAKKYNTLKEFAKGSHHAYWVATKNGWTEGYIWGDGRNGRKRNRWTEERCLNAGKEYSSRSDFFRGCPAGYNASLRRGLLDEIFGESKKRGRKTKEN